MSKGWWSIVGFVFFFLGFLSLAFQLVGLNFTFLSFIDKLPSPWSLVVYIVLMFGGMIVLYMSKMDRNIGEEIPAEK